jgi:Ca2+-binding RTX toxin-like protein
MSMIKGTKKDDSPVPTRGDDVIYGKRGDDHLYGIDGNDVLFGGRGDDWLVGGIGTDAMRGGKGQDTFAIVSLDDLDSILDFQPGEDRIIINDPDVSGLQPLLVKEFGTSVLYDGPLIYFKGQPIAVVGPDLSLEAGDFFLA